MTAETPESTYTPAPAPDPHPRRPYAVVDRDGFVWPWDGREPDEHLLAAGSSYIYSKAEFTKLVEVAKNKRYVAALLNPDDEPVVATEAVDAAAAAKAMGFRPEPKRRARSERSNDVVNGL